MRRPFWGRRYATEIGIVGLHFLDNVLGPDEIVSFTEVHNVRSRAVMERLGMSFVREIRAAGLIEGKEGVHDGARFTLYAMRRSSRRNHRTDAARND